MAPGMQAKRHKQAADAQEAGGAPVPEAQPVASMELTDTVVKPGDLLQLAASAPGLTSLTIWRLELDEANLGAPLTALKQLTVLQGGFSTTAGLRLSGVFQALTSLSCACECSFGAGAATFQGLSALQRLDIGRAHDDDESYKFDDPADPSGCREYNPGLKLTVADFEGTLAALPALRSLRTNAEGAHVEGACRFLPQLERLELVFVDRFINSFGDAQTALQKFTAPGSLKHVTLEFVGADEGDMLCDIIPPRDYGIESDVRRAVADAAASWLVRAPALESVEWTGSDLFGHEGVVTDLRLAACVLNPSIRRFEFSSRFDGTTAAMREAIERMQGGRGLEVVCREEGRAGYWWRLQR